MKRTKMEPLAKQTVLITGGAGSLGRAFVRLLHEKYKVIVVDSSEWALAETKGLYPDCTYWLGDFTDYPLSGYEDYIIHAAAYKHVELGEQMPREVVRNNISKTIEFYEKVEHSLARLLYISTDKAVEPTSVYGASKFIAERLTQNVRGSVARLGNILVSSGSVIPLWEEAIAKGKPVRITDERMTRYFIEDFDAANQIWHEFIQGKELIIPKMGEPIRILDLLTEVLKRHGYSSPEEYPGGVEIIGMRPGEKLSEKLMWENEHDGIHVQAES